MNTHTSPPVASTTRGRLLLVVGILLTLGAYVAYGAQIGMGRLTTPWYALGLATLGSVMTLFAFLQRPGIVRGLSLLLCVSLAGAAWWFVGLFAQLPGYTGPVAPGQAFPAFSTTLADGTPFTQESLKGDRDTILVFFRGRW